MSTSFLPYATFAYDDAVVGWDQNITSGGTSSGRLAHCPIDEGNSTGYGYDFYVTAQMVTGLFIYPAFCFPGLVGNILTVVVLSQRNMLTSTNAFLSALAVSDSIKLINDSLYFFVTLFFNIDPVLGNLSYGYLYPYAHFIFSMSVCVSSWLTVSVAVERYILVCHPTRARNIWSRKRAVMLCCAIYLVMTSLALPSAFRYRTIRCFDVQLNASRLEVELTEMWQDEIFVTSYTWAQNLLRSIIPLVVLVVLNVCIIRAVRRTRIKKKRKNSRHRVTIMMIVVILTFLICITPDAILSTVFGRGYHEAGMVTKGIREITDTLLTINAAVNFIIYCALNKVFRKSFTNLCCPRSKRKGGGWVTEMDESVYRRFSEAKVSVLSSNNNHSSRRQDPDSSLGNSDFPSSTPKSAISSEGNQRDSSRFRYSSLSGGDPSSPESPGFSSERMAFLTKQDLSMTESTMSDGFAERYNQQKRQNNRKSHNQHYRNSWNGNHHTHYHHFHHQANKHPKNSSHGLKKSRNSVKCNRGKRAGRRSSNTSDIDNENCGVHHNEAVTYVPKEEFQESLRRVSSGKKYNKFSPPKTTQSDLEDSEGRSSEQVNSEKKFVLDLKRNNQDEAKLDFSPTSFPLSPCSWPSSPYTSHNHDSPATVNSDVIMEDRHENNDTLHNDNDISNDHEIIDSNLFSPDFIENENSRVSDNCLHHATSVTSARQNVGDAIFKEASSKHVENGESPSESNVNVLEASRQTNINLEDVPDLHVNGNKMKKRALTVSFSDC